MYLRPVVQPHRSTTAAAAGAFTTVSRHWGKNPGALRAARGPTAPEGCEGPWMRPGEDNRAGARATRTVLGGVAEDSGEKEAEG